MDSRKKNCYSQQEETNIPSSRVSQTKEKIVKVTLNPIILGALGTISKYLGKRVGLLKIWRRVDIDRIDHNIVEINKKIHRKLKRLTLIRSVKVQNN